MATRVIGYKGDQVCEAIINAASQAANEIMDEHAVAARRLCPRREIDDKGNPISEGTEYRKVGGLVMREIAFTAYKGKKRERDVSFIAHIQTGRVSGNLRNTIRKVEKYNRPGNIRVYAGNQSVPYARFIEYGTASTGWGRGVKAHPYMRPSFQVIKPTIKQRIENAIRTVPEVRS